MQKVVLRRQKIERIFLMLFVAVAFICYLRLFPLHSRIQKSLDKYFFFIFFSFHSVVFLIFALSSLANTTEQDNVHSTFTRIHCVNVSCNIRHHHFVLFVMKTNLFAFFVGLRTKKNEKQISFRLFVNGEYVTERVDLMAKILHWKSLP